MKYFLMPLVIVATLLLSAFDGVPHADISWDATKHEFGVIYIENGRVSHTFRLVNSGTAPLVISKASVSCVCTKIEFRRAPLAPGDTTLLKVTYNPKGQRGFFATPIQVYSNAPHGRDIIVITGEVKSTK